MLWKIHLKGTIHILMVIWVKKCANSFNGINIFQESS